MSYRIYCDYCGRECPKGEEASKIRVTIVRHYDTLSEAKSYMDIDCLCVFCTNLFKGTLGPWKSPPKENPPGR